MYPIANGLNGRRGEYHDPDVVSEESSATTEIGTGRTHPPPIDAVDIGIVPQEVARVAQGALPRSPQDRNASIDDKDDNSGNAMDIE